MLISIASCVQKTAIESQHLSPIFDISPDDKNIVIAISQGQTSNLYIFSLDSNKLQQLTNDDGWYDRPVYSPTGNTIIFISKNFKTNLNALYSINLNNRQIKKLTNERASVIEATFTANGNGILYCASDTTRNYSSLGKKAPHGIDLYSMALDGSNRKRLTNFNAYEFSSITPSQSDSMILCRIMAQDIEGIYLLSLSNGLINKIEAVNNPRPEIGEVFYGSPSYSKDNKKITFIAPYQIYLLNLADKKCQKIWSTFGEKEQAMPIFSKFDNKNQKIFFSTLKIVNSTYSLDAQIYSYNLSTKAINQILIPFQN